MALLSVPSVHKKDFSDLVPDTNIEGFRVINLNRFAIRLGTCEAYLMLFEYKYFK